MKEVSRQVLPGDLQKTSPNLVLGANGTFVAADLPGLFSRDYAPQLDGGAGTWKLVSREGKRQVQLNFYSTVGSKVSAPYGVQLEVSEGWSEANLYYFLGDADERRRVSLRRNN